jgi:hypothetical protein
MALLWLARKAASTLVLVVMVAIGGVPVPVVGVVDMITVSDGLVSAAGPVHMRVAGMGKVRQRMLVVMSLMRRVGMAFVHVVDVTLALGAGMPAAWPVLVVRVGVYFMLGSYHGSSLL